MDRETKQIADTILDQLGGRTFVLLTGAKDFSVGKNKDGNVYLGFKIGSGPKNVRAIAITYVYGRDTYDVDFFKAGAKISKLGGNLAETHTDIYADMLVDLFENETGLYTHF